MNSRRVAWLLATLLGACSIPAETYTPALPRLMTSVSGGASGTVTCDGGPCAAEYPPGTQLTLTATPAVGAVFVSWSGGCSGTTATCLLTLDVDTAVDAMFDLPTHDLTLMTSGTGGATGSVVATPKGVACGPGCLRYARGTTVTLTPARSGTSYFSSWGGTCAGVPGPPCDVVMTTAQVVSATFAPANLAFVTSTAGAPPTNNPETWADDWCNMTAQAVPLPGHYVAVFDPTWMARLSATAQGWVRADGKPFALTRADLEFGSATGHALYPNVLDERGAAVLYGASVRTGQLPGYNCNGWTMTTGMMEFAGSVGGSWTTLGLVFGQAACGTALPLYCVGTTIT
jgi:hypothetical protein